MTATKEDTAVELRKPSAAKSVLRGRQPVHQRREVEVTRAEKYIKLLKPHSC